MINPHSNLNRLLGPQRLELLMCDSFFIEAVDMGRELCGDLIPVNFRIKLLIETRVLVSWLRMRQASLITRPDFYFLLKSGLVIRLETSLFRHIPQ